MEKRCKVCGTAEKVNFDGMCQKCYEDSIEIHENETMEEYTFVEDIPAGIFEGFSIRVY